MGNTKKTLIHIRELRVFLYLLLFVIRHYLKVSLVCSKFFTQKRTLLWQRNQNAKNLKIKFQQRGV